MSAGTSPLGIEGLRGQRDDSGDRGAAWERCENSHMGTEGLQGQSEGLTIILETKGYVGMSKREASYGAALGNGMISEIELLQSYTPYLEYTPLSYFVTLQF